ncbi:hypothetical protein HanRHA438_Chr17g0824081 [Helianthus annuus]|nr:hypothetical protein HanRHA438_Chr17g0824081 [Helianthus annuus]
MPYDFYRTVLYVSITLQGYTTWFLRNPSLLHVSVKCLKVDHYALLTLKRDF